MIVQLQQFKLDQADYNSEFGGGPSSGTRMRGTEELLKTNRFIKKEVIDVADLVEKVSKVLVIQNQKIDYLTALVQRMQRNDGSNNLTLEQSHSMNDQNNQFIQKPELKDTPNLEFSPNSPKGSKISFLEVVEMARRPGYDMNQIIN